MKTWPEAWDDATWEQKRTVIRWRPWVKRNAHIGKDSLNQCPTCLEFFYSVRSFDAHRTGSFGKPGVPSKRRCRTIPEMLEKGLVRNEYFYWMRKGMLDDAEDAS